MDQLINIITNNGLGFASFLALIYFYQFFMKDLKETNEEVLKTLIEMKTSLSLMNTRIERLENKNKGE